MSVVDSSPVRLPSRPSRGFSLIELLVAMVITLVMMGAVVSIFGLLGTSVGNSRSLIETSDRLRSAATRLQLDLEGATATMLPPLRPEADQGYLEYIEGPFSDWLPEDTMRPGLAVDLSATGTAAAQYSRLGDTDDILMFTTRARNEPFVGKMAVLPLTDPVTYVNKESRTAEVTWTCRKTPGTSGLGLTYTLYRQVRLVDSGIDVSAYDGMSDQYYEVSACYENGVFRANGLGDLTKRENRFMHYQNGFPYGTRYPDAGGGMAGYALGTARYGEDVILTNVLAFDVRAFDPDARVVANTGQPTTPLSPGDPGYFVSYPSTTPTTPPQGAFVDLGYNMEFTFSTTAPGYSGNLRNNSIASWFSGYNDPKSGLRVPSNTTVPMVNVLRYYPCTYDTWSLHYENNWQDSTGAGANGTKDAGETGDEFTNDNSATNAGIDNGMDGLDNDGDGVVDEPDEFETLPPYSKPLRGIQITIRVYEPDSRQVREITVVQNFIPD